MFSKCSQMSIENLIKKKQAQRKVERGDQD